jgi:uncharacterized protein with GYD domain
MPFYMFKARYTAAAIKAMVDNPQDREAPARKLIEAVGGKLHGLYFCFSDDDIIAIIEAPNDEAMAAGSLIIGASGAFSGGSTTKLMTAKEAMSAMAKAKKSMGSYTPATG